MESLTREECYNREFASHWDKLRLFAKKKKSFEKKGAMTSKLLPNANICDSLAQRKIGANSHRFRSKEGNKEEISRAEIRLVINLGQT